MTMNEIINQGKAIRIDSLPWHTGYTPLTILLCLVLILAFIGISYSLLKSKGNINIIVLSVSILMFLTTTGLTLKEINKVKKDVYNDQVNEWRNDAASVYIDSLPFSKKEVFDVNVESDIINKYTRKWWRIKYTNYDNEYVPRVMYSYKEGNETVTADGIFEVMIDLENNEKPYMEYQYLDENLGHGVNEGYYNVVIHLPENYTFVDNK